MASSPVHLKSTPALALPVAEATTPAITPLSTIQLPAAEQLAVPPVRQEKTSAANVPARKFIGKQALWIILMAAAALIMAGGFVWKSVRPKEPAFILTGHTDSITSLAFSNDGNLLISGSKDGSVQVWDINNGSLVKILYTGTSRISAVVLSPDGKYAAAGGSDGYLRAWSLETGEYLFTPATYRIQITSLAFSPDGTRIASGGEYGVVYERDRGTGDHIFSQGAHTSPITTLEYSPDGHLIASGSKNGTISITRRPLPVNFQPSRFNIIDLVYSSIWLISTSSDGVTMVWDGGSSESAIVLENDAIVSGALAIATQTSETPRLVSANLDGTVRYSDIDFTSRPVEVIGEIQLVRLATEKLILEQMALSQDGTLLAASCDDFSIHIWRLSH